MQIKELYNELINEKIFYTEYDSGLKAYVLPKNGFSKQFAVFATHYGSIDNKFKTSQQNSFDEVPDGIAHFLEHKLFEQEDENIFEKFSKLGGSPNAYTNYNTTAYLFLSTQNFLDCLTLLLDFVQHPYLTEENVEKEKGIIEQEIRMYEDNPGAKIFYNLMKCLYVNNPINIDIAGTVESIYKIDKDTLYKCYNTFYTPSNMMVFVAGDVDYKKVFQLIDEKFIKKETSDIERAEFDEPERVAKDYIESKLSVSIPMFNLGFKHNTVGLRGKDLIRNVIINNIILDMIFGRSSKFYNDMYNKGLINDTFGAEYAGDERYSFSIIGGESKDPLKVKDEIFNEIDSIKKVGLDKTVFERIKKMHIGKFIKQFDSIENISHTFTSYIFNDILLFDYIDVINSVEYNDVLNQFDELFNIENTALSVIKPI